MRVIAIIPARSGSKGLPDKNIKELNGIPLMAYTIRAAIETKMFDEIVVSTDSEQYADIAKTYGASVPFLRDKKLASDTTGSWDVVRDVLYNYRKIGKEFDICVLLQPTSPMRASKDILKAWELFRERNANTVTSVCKVDHPVQWCFKIGVKNSMDDFASSEYRNMRRQQLDQYYRENGAIYIVRTKDIEKQNHDIYKQKCFGFVMDSLSSIDIDTQLDFDYAEWLLNKIL